MNSLSAGDLRIEAVETSMPRAVQLFFCGKSNERQPEKVIGPYVRTALDRAAEQKWPLEMHFENLKHFNSATITSIIRLIQEARAKNVRMVIIYDGRQKWQKLSFDAMQVFATDELLSLRGAP